LLWFDSRDTLQLFSQHALFKGKLFNVGHMLHAASAATTEMPARGWSTHGAAQKHTFGTSLDDFAVSIEHSRFDFFTRQAARHKPRLAFKERNATAVIGQALDRQPLLFAGRDLVGPGTACWLEAQASFVFGHQLGAS
jgi:hypothetical protein